jgi:hypothetical protein
LIGETVSFNHMMHLVKHDPESVTPEPATAWLAPMASKIAVHRPFGAAALLPWCVGRLS